MTDPTKKPKPLALQDPNNPDQPIPLQPQQPQPAQIPSGTQAPTITPQQVTPVAPQSSATSQLAQQTLQQAAGQAQTGYSSPTATATSQATQNLLADPNMGYSPEKAVSEYDVNAAKALETARQGLVGASGSSLAQSRLKDLALETAEGRSAVQQSASEQARNNALAAISAGQTTTGMEQAINSGNIQNLLSVLSAAEPQLQREETAVDRGIALAQSNQNAQLQTMLTELQGKISAGLQTNAQDWQGIQNELDREIKKWTASGNWQNALDAIKLKGEIDIQAQKDAQIWSTGERVATQAFTTSERLSSQDFVSAESYLDRLLKESIANNDNATQKWVTEKQAELQLKMQTNEMTFEEKMAYLNEQFKDADVGRQQTILQFQHGLRLVEMNKEFSHEQILEEVKADLQKSINEGDYANARALQKAELEYRVNKDIEDRKIEWAANALQEKGLDMQILQQQLDNIDDMIENYGIDPSFKTEFVKATLDGQGIDTSGFEQIDVTAKAQQALSEEYDLMLFQFGQSHPEYVDKTLIGYGSQDGVIGQGTYPIYEETINANGLQAFSDYYNYTMYGELSDAMREERRTAGYLGASDLPNALEGDKFKITEATTYNGVSVPPGEYTVQVRQSSAGSKFFGTKHNYDNYYLVGKDGSEIYIQQKTTGVEGNLISDLWAGDTPDYWQSDVNTSP